MKKIIKTFIFFYLLLSVANSFAQFAAVQPINPNATLEPNAAPGCTAPTAFQLTDINPALVPGNTLLIRQSGRAYTGSSEGVVSYFRLSGASCPQGPFPMTCLLLGYFPVPTSSSVLEVYTGYTSSYVPHHYCQLVPEDSNFGIKAYPIPFLNGVKYFQGVGVTNILFKQDKRHYCITQMSDAGPDKIVYLEKGVPTTIAFKFRENMQSISFDNTSSLNIYGINSNLYSPESAVLDNNRLMKFNFISPNPLPNESDYWSFYFTPFGKYANGVIDKLFDLWVHAVDHQGRISFVDGYQPITIYQVIHNPILNYPSTVVDLVAGKNADIFLKTSVGANKDISGTVLKWKSRDGLTTKTFSPKINTTNENQEIIFEINPVPSESNFVGGETTFEIEMSAMTECQAEPVISKYAKTVHIRKTKPIRLEYVRLVNPALYASPSSTDMSVTMSKGSELTRLLFPVADADFSITESFLPFIGSPESTGKNNNLDWIRLTQARNIYNANSIFKQNTHVVALVSKEYVDFNVKDADDPDTWSGFTLFNAPFLFISAGRIGEVPHELAHANCIRYDGLNSCHLPIENESEHAFSETLNSISYLNYDTSDITMNRGILNNRLSLMSKYGEAIPALSAKWIDDIGYLQLFNNSIESASFKANLNTKVLNIIGSVNSSNALSLDQIFVSKNNNSNIQNCLPTGEYVLKIMDRNKNIISSCYIHKKNIIYEYQNNQSTPMIQQIFDTNFILANNAVFARLEKVNSKNISDATEIVIPTDLISNNLKFIPDVAFKKEKNMVLNQVKSILSESRRLIIDGQIEFANKVLSKQLYPLINDSISSDFQRTSITDMGQFEFQNMISDAVVGLSSLKPASSSPFFQISKLNNSIVNATSLIRVDFVNQPTNPESQMVFEVYFDNQIIKTSLNKNYLTAESLLLTPGQHTWHVKTYLVNKKLWNSADANIKYWTSEIAKLEAMLIDQFDPQKIQEIRNRQQIMLQRSLFFQAEKNRLKSEIGNPVNLFIEVI